MIYSIATSGDKCCEQLQLDNGMILTRESLKSGGCLRTSDLDFAEQLERLGCHNDKKLDMVEDVLDGMFASDFMDIGEISICGKLSEQNATIKALEQQSSRWIPISESLPDDGETIICTDGAYMYIIEFHADWDAPFADLDGIKAWMYAPEMYVEN